MDHPLSHLPVNQRIEISLAVLDSMPIQEAGGWTYQALGEICGCSKSAIQQIEAKGLKIARFRLRKHNPNRNQHYERQTSL